MNKTCFVISIIVLSILVCGCLQPSKPEGASKEAALDAIELATTEIAAAEGKGNDATAANGKLSDAKSAFDNEDYSSALALAEEAKNLAKSSKSTETKPASSKPGTITGPYPPPDANVTNAGNVSWSPDIVISTSESGSIHKSFCNANSIAVGQNGAVHAVWYVIRDGNDEIHYRRSLDDGITWEADEVLSIGPNFIGDVTLTTTSGHEFTVGSNGGATPALAVSESNVYVVWRSDLHSSRGSDSKQTNGEIYFKRSTNSGASWGSDIRLTNASGDSTSSSISAFGNNVYVVWVDARDGDGDIYFKRSEDYGATWSKDMRLTKSAGLRGQPTVSASGSTLLVFWMDNRDGNWEIYHMRSTDDGETWSDDIRFSFDEGVSEVPVVAFSGNSAHVAWPDSRTSGPEEHYIDAYEIYYRRSTDGGASWSDETRLTNAPKWSADPSIAVLGSYVHVVWPERRDMNGSGREDDRDIYYKYSTNEGASWTSDFRLTNAIGESGIPSIALSNSTIHIIWEDSR
ncbi:MAG: hypothetical protein V1861_05640, partial [Candidatus Micrarchaeota archaeon]